MKKGSVRHKLRDMLKYGVAVRVDSGYV